MKKYLWDPKIQNPNEMDWHCGEQSFERVVGEREKNL